MNALIWPIVLMLAGLSLLVLEVFIPSGGLIGLLALGCLILSVWKAFAYSTMLGLQFIMALIFLLPGALLLAAHVWPRTPLAKRIFLKPPSPAEIEPADAVERLDHLVGQFGRALTPLRPSGMVDIDGRRLDALSEEGLIPMGALVRAVQIRSGQVVVRMATDRTLNEIMT